MSGGFTLRPWRPGDETAFTPRADFACDMAANGHDWSSGPPAGMTWAVVRAGPDGERVAGLAGVMAHGRDAAHVWACLADLSPRDLGRCVRLARLAVDELSALLRPRRIIAEAREADAAAVNCLIHLGFSSAGYARRQVGDVVYQRMGREG